MNFHWAGRRTGNAPAENGVRKSNSPRTSACDLTANGVCWLITREPRERSRRLLCLTSVRIAEDSPAEGSSTQVVGAPRAWLTSCQAGSPGVSMTDRDRTFHRLMAATRKRKAEDRHASRLLKKGVRLIFRRSASLIPQGCSTRKNRQTPVFQHPVHGRSQSPRSEGSCDNGSRSKP